MDMETQLSIAMSDEEFEVIEAAFLKSPRGRSFLAEYVRRSQLCKSDPLDDAIRKLQTTVQYLPRGEAPGFGVEPQQMETRQHGSPAPLKIDSGSGVPIDPKLAVSGERNACVLQRSPARRSSPSSASTRPETSFDSDEVARQIGQLYARSLEQAIDLARLAKVTASRGRLGGRR